jgi:hypothetical protein
MYFMMTIQQLSLLGITRGNDIIFLAKVLLNFAA